MTHSHNPRRKSQKRPRRRKRGKVLTITRTSREVRKSNPSRPRRSRLYMLVARKPGSPLLKYVGGFKFATRGKAMLFGNRATALAVARVLRLKFPALRAYRLSAL